MKETSEIFLFGFAIIVLLAVIVVSIFSITRPPSTEIEENKGEKEMTSGLEKILNLIGASGGEIFEQPISESISANTQSSLDIAHSHGDVTVKGWDKDEVKLEGKKIVRARDVETARMYAEMMKVEISSQGDRIILKTIRPERDSSWKVNQITINYQLYAPKRMNVSLKNAHGNVSVGDFMGNLDANCRHGNLQASQMGKDVVIDHEHGNVEVSGIDGKVSVDKQHGNLNIQSVSDGLKMNHEHGNVTLSMIEKGAELIKRHGKLSATNVNGPVILDNAHGHVELRLIEGNVEIKNQHNNIDAEAVKGNLSIHSDHGNLRIIGIEGDVYLRGNHGNAHVENVSGTADIIRSYSKVTLNNVKNVAQH